KLFNEPIPLLGKSVRELLAFTDQITAAFNNVSGQIQTLKPNLLELLNGGPTVTGIKQVLEDAGFVNALTPVLQNKLLVAVEALQAGVLSLPDTIASALSFKAPARLVSALAAAADAVEAIRSVFDPTPTPPQLGQLFADLESAVRGMAGKLPTVQGALGFLFDA